jgi:putative DNA primase/helicase
MNTVANILGDYHRNAPIETFTATRNEQHPTELAMLRGARLVTATETEEGRHWAESRIKMLTGGEKISARFMRQDFFAYTPQFKLIISGNHKPGLRSVDEAIRSRLNLVPFTVFIPLEERDLKLSEKLKDEWPGILTWMINGCLEWQRDGLAPPPAVQAATTEYLEAEDTVQLWINEHCEIGRKYYSLFSTLYTDWKIWAEAHGEYVLPAKRFAERLDSFGYQLEKRGKDGKRGRLGLRLHHGLREQ